MCYGYIYKITDTTNGKQYIGQHKFNKYFSLDNGYHGSGNIVIKIYKKRSETLQMEYLMPVDSLEESNFFENYWIEKLNTLYPNGYNLVEGGGQPPHFKQSKETIEKRFKTIKERGKHTGWKKGHTPWNKGKKGYMGANETSFKNEHTPWNKGKKVLNMTGINHPSYKNICPLLLYKYRVCDNLSYKKISDLFNVDKKTIINKCNKYNINKDDNQKVD